MGQWIFTAFFLATSIASGAERSYRCFDIYNFYNNARYTAFSGENDFEIIQALLTSSDPGTLSLVINDNEAVVQGFDEQAYDGLYKSRPRAQESLFSFAQNETASGQSLAFELKDYRPEDAPKDLTPEKVVSGTFSILRNGVPTIFAMDVVCGLATLDNQPVAWSQRPTFEFKPLPKLVH